MKDKWKIGDKFIYDSDKEYKLYLQYKTLNYEISPNCIYTLFDIEYNDRGVYYYFKKEESEKVFDFYLHHKTVEELKNKKKFSNFMKLSEYREKRLNKILTN